MPVIEKFAIKHKPTGHYLPVATGRMGRGGSHVEPTEVQPLLLATHPRMFDTKRGAENCLSQWLRGKHHAVREYEDDDWGTRAYLVDVGTSIEPVASRVREDMEVVVIKIHL